MPNTYDLSTDVGKVRLLTADIGDGVGGETGGHPFVLTDESIQAALDIEGNVKLAAATLIDANALNEALSSKVIRTASGETTDGAKLADAMHKLADGLRKQVVDADAAEGYVDIVDTVPVGAPWLDEPELSGWPGSWWP